MTRILITDGEQRSSLSATRSLGIAGHHVVVCSCVPRPLAGASRSCRAAYLVPDPKIDPAGFKQAVEEVVDKEAIEVLLPMTDVSMSLLLRRIRETRPAVMIAGPEHGAYDSISNKRHLLAVARELDVPVPKQIVLTKPECRNLPNREIEELGLPLILKPARSVVSNGRGVRKVGVHIASTMAAAVTALAQYPAEAYPILVQERINGPGLGAFFLSREGTTVASFAHTRIREKPPTGGVSVYRESVPLRDDVRAYSERILGHFNWSGVAMVEFKEDRATGTPYLMEVNGRFWGSLQLAIDAGVDFPAMLVQLALGEEIPRISSYRVGVRSRWLWGDFDHMLWMLRAPRGYRRTAPMLPGRLRSVARFVMPWRPRDRLEILRLGDLRPFLRESAQWFSSLMH